MFDALYEFTNSFPEFLQWAGVLLISAIPFVESYFGSTIGVVTGTNPVVAITAAILGNAISMLFFVLSAHGVRSGIVSGKAERTLTPRRQKLRAHFERFGVPGVSLLGQLILPSQITSAAMVSFGAPKNTVILWQVISIIIWGVAFGSLASVGVTMLR